MTLQTFTNHLQTFSVYLIEVLNHLTEVLYHVTDVLYHIIDFFKSRYRSFSFNSWGLVGISVPMQARARRVGELRASESSRFTLSTTALFFLTLWSLSARAVWASCAAVSAAACRLRASESGRFTLSTTVPLMDDSLVDSWCNLSSSCLSLKVRMHSMSNAIHFK